MADWRSYLAANQERFLGELFDLLRIPSVSTEPAHTADVQRAARWTVDRLGAAGMEHAAALPTARHPVVYADWLHAPGEPTVLLYGHVDVQPPHPVDAWTTPPFEPTVRDDRVYARGAADMKAGIVALAAAVEALMRTTGRLPVNVKFFVEAEEEIGSPSIPAFLAAERERFACDMVLSADGPQRDEHQPVLWIGSRGLAGVQVDVRGAATDLHSGIYGGVAPNAANALVDLLGTMRTADGRVLVAGFYDDVRPLTEQDRAEIAAVAVDEAELRRQIGCRALVGEPGYTAAERNAARPTFDVNGLWGGFQGEGVKTVIPNEAHAKITCRLVPDQDPQRIIDCIVRHVAAHVPPGVEATVVPLPGRARPYALSREHAGLRAAASVLAELYGNEPLLARVGGTLPVKELFLDALGAHTVPMGFGLFDDHVHASDEFFRLSGFRRAPVAYVLFLERLAAGASDPGGRSVAPLVRTLPRGTGIECVRRNERGGARVDASERIDNRIAELGDWRGELIARLRGIVRAADPQIVEEWKWDTPVWSRNGMICAAGAFKGAVKLNFFKGASLPDPDKLFNAGLGAKTTRAIDFHQGDRVDEAALTRLVKTAIAHNLG